MKRGSVPHLRRLSADFDKLSIVEDGALAVEVVFRLLEKEEIPSIFSRLDEALTPDEMHQKALRIRRSLVFLLSVIEAELQSEDKVIEALFSDVVLEHASTLIRWLAFVSRNSGWVYREDCDPEFDGPATAARALRRLWSAKSLNLRLAVWTSDYTLDLVLWLWMFDDGEGHNLNNYFTKDDDDGHPFVSLMVCIITGPSFVAASGEV